LGFPDYHDTHYNLDTSDETQVIRDSRLSLVVYPEVSDVRLTYVSLNNKFFTTLM
jgi:hypothetical protein